MFPYGIGGSSPPSGTKGDDLLARMNEPRPAEPSFRALLLGSLRVCAVASALALLAFGIWRALCLVFPEAEWLRVAR